MTLRIKPALILMLCVVFSLVFAQCSDGPGGDPPTIISGQVTDSVSGQPIDSAWISLFDTTQSAEAVFSDSLGIYKIDALGYGSFTVYCLKDNYRTKWQSVVSSKDQTTLDSVNFRLSN